jgi:hypothetical protein
LNWLVSHPNGHAFIRLHIGKTEKEFPMTPIEHVRKAVQDRGAIQVCKDIIGLGHSPVSEHELTAALTKYASEQFNMPGDRAFAKLAESDASVLRACHIAAKSMPVTPSVAVGPDAFPSVRMRPGSATTTHEDDSTLREEGDAYQQLVDMAEKMREAAPELKLSAAQAFDKVISDPKNAALAASAHRRPVATTFFEFPR